MTSETCDFNNSDPLFLLITAAEFAKASLEKLDNAGVIPQGLDDDGRARYAYIAHHEGAQGAIDILRGNLNEERASYLLSNQFQDSQQGRAQRDAALTKFGGNSGFPFYRPSYKTAYEGWLIDYTNRKIQPQLYR